MTRTLNRTVEAGGKLYPAGTPEADVDGLVEREDVWDGDPDPQDPNDGEQGEGDDSDGDQDEAPEPKPTSKGRKTS